MKSKMLLLLLTVLCLSLGVARAQDATPAAPSMDELAKMFAYDASAPLDIQEAKVEDHDGVSVHDLTFASGVKDTARVTAYLVVPPGSGPFAAVLYVHWLGEAKSDRTEFLDESLKMAKLGVVSVLVDGAWAHGVAFWNRDTQHDQEVSVKQVVDLRRALDVLIAQPNVDSKRIAVVAHDFGAMYASVLAGVDRRPTGYVLIAGTPSFSDWFLPYGRGKSLTGDERQKYIADMAVFDPPQYIAQASPAKLLFQFSRSDQYVPEDKALAYYQAASTPRRLELYDIDHAFQLPAAEDARISWLTDVLNLK